MDTRHLTPGGYLLAFAYPVRPGRQTVRLCRGASNTWKEDMRVTHPNSSQSFLSCAVCWSVTTGLLTMLKLASEATQHTWRSHKRMDVQFQPCGTMHMELGTQFLNTALQIWMTKDQSKLVVHRKRKPKKCVESRRKGS
jgi:hypothetical protein